MPMHISTMAETLQNANYVLFAKVIDEMGFQDYIWS